MISENLVHSSKSVARDAPVSELYFKNYWINDLFLFDCFVPSFLLFLQIHRMFINLNADLHVFYTCLSTVSHQLQFYRCGSLSFFSDQIFLYQPHIWNCFTLNVIKNNCGAVNENIKSFRGYIMWVIFKRAKLTLCLFADLFFRTQSMKSSLTFASYRRLK